MDNTVLKSKLEDLYHYYNHPKYIDPDPLMYVINYDSNRDKEIVALIASSLAYGKVKQIKRSINNVLNQMGKSPYKFLMEKSYEEIRIIFFRFKHRFTTGEEFADFLFGIKCNLEKYSTLENCFLKGYSDLHVSTYPALCLFAEKLKMNNREKNSLLPKVEKGSASKRLHLFLRWLVRSDNVDLGIWKNIDKRKLIIPLDTHIYRIAGLLEMTERKSIDLKCAGEITAKFKDINPQDPVKYDFSLSRLGIRENLDNNSILEILSS